MRLCCSNKVCGHARFGKTEGVEIEIKTLLAEAWHQRRGISSNHLLAYCRW